MTDITVVVFVTIKTCHGNVVCTEAPSVFREGSSSTQALVH